MKLLQICITVILFSGIAGIVGACSSYNDLRGEVRSMTGKNISVVTAKLGQADEILPAKNYSYYVWLSGVKDAFPSDFNDSGSTIGHGSDVVGEEVFDSTPTFGCAIRLRVDEHNIIRGWELRQGLSNCSTFAKRLSL